MTLSAHTTGELVHDSAKHFRVGVLDVLAKLHHVDRAHLEARCLLQGNRHRHLERCRRAQPCAELEITVDDSVEAGIDQASQMQLFHNADYVARPAARRRYIEFA